MKNEVHKEWETGKKWKTGLIGEIETREITLADYDPLWSDKFQEQAKSIRTALGNKALRIEHIGSTAVPGLAAKAIIDILLVVEDSADEDIYLPQLKAAGYELRVREPDWHQHCMLRTPGKDVHVHVFSAGSPQIERHLVFRDRLRCSADDRKLYEQTKRRLAAQSWPSMDAYASAKTEVIESILAAAHKEAKSRRV